MSDSPEQDWQRIKAFQAGDRTAFETLFHQYKKTVLNLAYRLVRDRETAEDITQEVFLKLYEQKRPFDERAKFSTWLYRVTTNASLDRLRKQKTVPLPLAETIVDPTPLPGETLEQEAVHQAVQQAIAELPEPLRIPILLYQFEEMPYADIGEILGISKKAVERRLAHAKTKLREQLAKHLRPA